MNRRAAIVVLTATITPAQGMAASTRNDPGLRLKDYTEAFSFYLGLPDDCVDRIVLLENSGADLDPFRRLVDASGSQKKVEFQSVSSQYDGSKGKGYGEFLMLDKGLAQSALIDDDSTIWKVTGRLRIMNLPALIRSTPAGCDVYCDLRDVPLIGDRLGGNPWMELRVFAFTRAGYDRHFRGRYDEDYVLEVPFFHRLSTDARSSGSTVVPRFRVQPRIAGFSGHSNSDYAGFAYRTRDIVRAISRRLAPGLWL